MGSTAAPWGLEVDAHAAALEGLDGVVGEGRAEHVPAEALQLLAVTAVDGRRGVQLHAESGYRQRRPGRELGRRRQVRAGLQVDAKDRGWIARNGGACLIQIDTVNNTIVNQNINIPGCQTVVGVSIDIEGFVWVVDQGGRAYKVNPDTLATQTVMGFASPYTYSDMTGAGIRLQALPQ